MMSEGEMRGIERFEQDQRIAAHLADQATEFSRRDVVLIGKSPSHMGLIGEPGLVGDVRQAMWFFAKQRGGRAKLHFSHVLSHATTKKPPEHTGEVDRVNPCL